MKMLSKNLKLLATANCSVFTEIILDSLVFYSKFSALTEILHKSYMPFINHLCIVLDYRYYSDYTVQTRNAQPAARGTDPALKQFISPPSINQGKKMCAIIASEMPFFFLYAQLLTLISQNVIPFVGA